MLEYFLALLFMTAGWTCPAAWLRMHHLAKRELRSCACISDSCWKWIPLQIKIANS